MNYDPISSLESIGYVEREASFLYLVAVHSVISCAGNTIASRSGKAAGWSNGSSKRRFATSTLG